MKPKKVITIFFTIFILTGIIFLQSCSDDTVTAPPPAAEVEQLIYLDTAYAIGAKALVSIYVEESLKVGYNTIYVVLNDSATGTPITNAHIQFDVVNHGHNTPVENPGETPDANGRFIGAWILNAPQSGDHWHYHVHVHNHQATGKPEGEAEFGNFVVKDNPNGFKSIIMPDSTKLYLSYIKPKEPVTGMNDFEFIINRNEPELFPPDGTYSIVMTPEYIPDGHSTSGNVNPAGFENGHYNGDVNFDRSGDWRIKLRVSKNGFYYDTYFELNY